MRRDERIGARARTLARAVLVNGFARNVTSALETARDQAVDATTVLKRRGLRALGVVADVSDDVLAFLDPATWLQDVYRSLGIASTNDLGELDDRIDRVEMEIDQVARQRAREELMLLQERIGELETVLSQLRRGESTQTRDAMGALLGRLSELETRIDAMPWRKFEPGAA